MLNYDQLRISTYSQASMAANMQKAKQDTLMTKLSNTDINDVVRNETPDVEPYKSENQTTNMFADSKIYGEKSSQPTSIKRILGTRA